jgi:hypothetical protein
MGYSAKHKLSNEIRLKCSALFTEQQASLDEECSYPQPFGNAWIILRVVQILLRFVWDRGVPMVEIQYSGQDGGWHNLDDKITHLSGRDTTVVPLTWERWCDLFSINHELLQNAGFDTKR